MTVYPVLALGTALRALAWVITGGVKASVPELAPTQKPIEYGRSRTLPLSSRGSDGSVVLTRWRVDGLHRGFVAVDEDVAALVDQSSSPTPVML